MRKRDRENKKEIVKSRNREREREIEIGDDIYSRVRYIVKN